MAMFCSINATCPARNHRSYVCCMCAEDWCNRYSQIEVEAMYVVAVVVAVVIPVAATVRTSSSSDGGSHSGKLEPSCFKRDVMSST